MDTKHFRTLALSLAASLAGLLVAGQSMAAELLEGDNIVSNRYSSPYDVPLGNVYTGRAPFNRRLETPQPAPPPRPLPPPVVRQVPPPPAPRPVTGEGCNYLVNLVKRAPSMVALGETFAYEIYLVATCMVGDVTVIDTLPAGATFVSSDPATTPEGGKLTWRFPSMNRGDTRTIKITVKADKEGDLVNCTTVSAIPRVCVTTMVGKPQLTIRKTGPEMGQLGQSATFNILVSNTGNTTAKDVVVTDTVPEGLSHASGQKEVTMPVGDLAPGASRPLSITLRADKRGKFVNHAVASSSNAGKVEADAPITVVQPGLKIEKTTKDKDLFINRVATYDIVVSNTGDTDLTGVVVTDTPAPGTTITAAEGATITGTMASWNLGTLKAGEKKTLSVKINSRNPGRFTNKVGVTSAQGLQESAQDWTEWKGVTGVLLEMVDDPDPIQVGETTRFTIRVTNQGATRDITDLNIATTLPAELDVVPGSVSDGGQINGKNITWPAVQSVPPKGAVTRSFQAKGVKAGDARTKVSIKTTARPEPIEKFESTTVY